MTSQKLSAADCAELSKISYASTEPDENALALALDELSTRVSLAKKSTQGATWFLTSQDMNIDPENQTGYFGYVVLKRREEKFDVYIVHRGTCVEANMIANIAILLGKLPHRIIQDAFRFTEHVINTLNEQSGIRLGKIYHAGHSLGGYLAILAAARTKIFHRGVGGAIAFDCPGTRRVLAHLHEHQDEALRVNKDELIVHCYLTEPNLVNTHGKHVGQIFQHTAYASKGPGSIYEHPVDKRLSADSAELMTFLLHTVNTHSIDKLAVHLHNHRGVREVKPDTWPVATNRLIKGDEPRADELLKVPSQMLGFAGKATFHGMESLVTSAANGNPLAIGFGLLGILGTGYAAVEYGDKIGEGLGKGIDMAAEGIDKAQRIRLMLFKLSYDENTAKGVVAIQHKVDCRTLRYKPSDAVSTQALVARNEPRTVPQSPPRASRKRTAEQLGDVHAVARRQHPSYRF